MKQYLKLKSFPTHALSALKIKQLEYHRKRNQIDFIITSCSYIIVQKLYKIINMMARC